MASDEFLRCPRQRMCTAGSGFGQFERWGVDLDASQKVTMYDEFSPKKNEEEAEDRAFSSFILPSLPFSWAPISFDWAPISLLWTAH